MVKGKVPRPMEQPLSPLTAELICVVQPPPLHSQDRGPRPSGFTVFPWLPAGSQVRGWNLPWTPPPPPAFRHCGRQPFSLETLFSCCSPHGSQQVSTPSLSGIHFLFHGAHDEVGRVGLEGMLKPDFLPAHCQPGLSSPWTLSACSPVALQGKAHLAGCVHTQEMGVKATSLLLCGKQSARSHGVTCWTECLHPFKIHTLEPNS